MYQVIGEVLAARVQIAIAAGLTNQNALLKQATVRRNIVVQYIRMQKDSCHPDYTNADMKAVTKQATLLAATDAPTIPNGLVDLLEDEGEEKPFIATEKVATLAERVHSQQQLSRKLENAMP